MNIWIVPLHILVTPNLLKAALRQSSSSFLHLPVGYWNLHSPRYSDYGQWSHCCLLHISSQRSGVGKPLLFPLFCISLICNHPLHSDCHQSPPDPQCISSKSKQTEQCPNKSFHLVYAPTHSSPCFLLSQ